MRTEYAFSDAQKKAIAEIDKKIFALQLQKAAIMSVTPIRCVFGIDGDDDLKDMHEWAKFNSLLGEPLIREGVVKIVPYEKESEDLSEE